MSDETPNPYPDLDEFRVWIDQLLADGSLDLKDKYEDPAFYYIPLATFSDYTGCAVERANARVLIKDETISPYLSVRYGGYGTEWLGFDESSLLGLWLDNDARVALEDVFRSDYPSLDDMELSAVEADAEQEALESWAMSDFESALNGRAEELLPDDEFYRFLGVSLEFELVELFEIARERANEYWIIETGGNAWIDVDRVASYVTDEEILALPRMEQ